MSGSMEPPRLRELDPLLREAVERAHAQRPSAASIENVVRAVEKASLGSTSVGTLSALKSAALKLATLAAFSSGLWWAVHHLGPGQGPGTQAAEADAHAPVAVPATPATLPSQSAGLASRADPSVAANADAKPTSEGPGHPAAVAPAPEAARESSVSTAQRAPSASASPAAPHAYADRASNSAHVWQSPRPSARSVPKARRLQALERAQTRNLSAPERELARPELALLEQAQEALQTSPEQALGLTEQHLRDYPNGAFAQEREQIAIEALFAAGRMPAMRERALHFRAAFPSSAYSARILQLLKSAR